jgi:hypothetical protein
MKIGLLGPNTQVQHISKLFDQYQIEYVNLNDSLKMKNKFLRFLEFVKMIKDVDIVYGIYGGHNFNLRFGIAKIYGKKVINHWIGSDVLEAQKNRWYRINQLFININLSCSNLIKDEIKELGIDSIELPIIPSGLDYNLSEMPSQHAVLVYLPEGKEDFYGIDYIDFLAKKYEAIDFFIVANSNSELLPYKNVHFMGKLNLEEMEQLYKRISILIRLPRHDGLSLMLLEALAKGKEVIYIYDFPFVNTVKNLEELVECFEKIIESPPKINIDGHNYIKNNYNDRAVYERFMNIIKEL